MNKFSELEYLSNIPATEANALAMQALTLQDVTAGNFENPTNLANPEDPDKVAAQLKNLSQNSEAYSGYQHESGLLVAYMKSGEWRIGDELPFIENAFAAKALRATSKLRKGSLRPKAFGVFGLVASESLPDHDRDTVLRDLLSRSIGQAAAKSVAVINIVLHEQDPATPIVDDLGFRPLGQLSEAAGAPGLAQQRYQLER